MMGDVDRQQVQDWVDAYVRWWRASDPAGVTELFAPEVVYLRSPYAEPLTGHEELARFWVADEGVTFDVTTEVVAADGRTGVARLQVDYRAPEQEQYRDLWVLRFAEDGRVEHFEEWAYFPGQPWTTQDATE